MGVGHLFRPGKVLVRCGPARHSGRNSEFHFLEEVRRRTGQPPVTCTIVSMRLRLFGHIARADPSHDHSRALQAAINRLPTDWRRRRGGSVVRTIESDLQPTNLGLNSAWLRAQDRSKWRSVVETAMLTAGRAT